LKKSAFLHVFLQYFFKAARKFHAGNDLRGGKKRLVLMTAPFLGRAARTAIFGATR
jgi:hypothetical protein